MDELLEGIGLVIIYSLPVFIASLVAYGVSLELKELFKIDILSAANYIIVLIISFVPLAVTILQPSIFDSQIYQNYLAFTNKHLIGMITGEIGVLFHPLWKKVF